MTSSTSLAKISDVLAAVKQSEPAPIRGINVIINIAGNFYQFAPGRPKSGALYALNNPMIFGRFAYNMFCEVVVCNRSGLAWSIMPCLALEVHPHAYRSA
jgi:hypothetical protein